MSELPVDMQGGTDQIVVTGMHRSGTSVVARMLSLMGAHFGPREQVMAPTAANPKGYWERRDVNELNRALMSVDGAAWDRVLPMEARDISQPALEWLQEIASPLLADMEQHRPWFLKDPRFCFTLPYFLRLGVTPVVVAVLRHPLEVARSLLHRDAIPMEAGLALWEAYNLRLLHWIRALPSVLVAHADVASNPPAAARSLFDALAAAGIGGLRAIDPVELKAFYDPALYRERSGDVAMPRHLDALWNALLDPGVPVGPVLSEPSRNALQRYEARPLTDLRLKKMARKNVPVNQEEAETQAARGKGSADPAAGAPARDTASHGLKALAARLDAIERRSAEAALAAAKQDLERRELQMLLTRAAEDAVGRALYPQLGALTAALQDRLDRWQREFNEEFSRAFAAQLARTPAEAAISRDEPVDRTALPASEPLPVVSGHSAPGADGEDALRARNSQLEGEIDRLAAALGEARLQLEQAHARDARREEHARELSKSADMLAKRLSAIRKNVGLLRGSARWRIGDLLVRAIELAMLRRRRETVLDEMERIVR